MSKYVPKHLMEAKKPAAKKERGEMARQLVYFCIRVLTTTAIWACALKTYGVIMDRSVDLSDVLVFIGTAFGGELLMLLFKRVFAKPQDGAYEEQEE